MDGEVSGDWGVEMIYGYLRVSTEKQDLDVQKKLLLEYAQDNGFLINDFIEVKISTRKTAMDRRIEELIDKLNPEDTLIVAELSRLGRSMLELLSIVQRIHEKGARLIFVRQGFLNTSEENPFQKVILSIFAAFAEVERDFISIRTKAGLAKARESKTLGRPKGSLGKSKLDSQTMYIKQLIEAGVAIRAIARLLTVAESTLRRWAERRGILLKDLGKSKEV